MLPAVSFVQITVVGQLIVSEVLAVALLPWLWGAKDRLHVPRWFLLLWGAWLVSQIATDLVMRSPIVDYARGWAAILFTLTDFAAILVLVSTPRRARLFALGLAASGVLSYFIAPNIYAAGDPWKWAFAMPVGFTLAAALSGSISTRMPLVPIGAFAAFGALTLLLGFRSLGGVAVIAAGYLLLNTLVGRRQARARPSIRTVIVGLVFSMVAAFSVSQGYDAAASGGLLGPGAQAKYLAQSGSLGVLVGGRPEILASTQAIIDSPILGHGSWAKDFKYVDLLTARLSSLGYEIGAGPSDVGLIPAHSYLLGSWVWAGLLGGVFWLAILLLAGGLLVNLYAVRLRLEPLLVFSAALLIWNIVFSPYGSSSRPLAAYGIALCLLGLSQVRGEETHPAPAPPRPTRDGSPLIASRSGGSADGWTAARDRRSAPGRGADST
ncbi:MAG: hypothetical protein IVW53_10710 [Chloroflexi bacterium]|nr:hypothetical protein [Chloroflexota bacterium]